MARLRISESPRVGSRESSVTFQSAAHHQRATAISPSDKENEGATSGANPKHRRVARVSTMTDSQSSSSPRSPKRRRLQERPANIQLQDADVDEDSDANSDSRYYDPHQAMETRQELRKNLRSLNNELNDNRQEWMASDSKGLRYAVKRANNLFEGVKQTSDATIDSRFLVSAGELAYKKSAKFIGDTSQGVDVDEFVGKCITFMRQGSEEQGSHRRRVDDEDDDEDDSAGDALNWSWLGTHACFPASSRPPVPGFLLGPLSVQKRVRAARVRTARNQRSGPVEERRPEELRAGEFGQATDSSLTTMCKNIHNQVHSLIANGDRHLNAAYARDASEEEVDVLRQKYMIADDLGLPLFQYAINPGSFGQTVENLFYITFLIRDGMIGLNSDDDGMPTLHDVSKGDSAEDRQREQPGAMRHQGVFSIDFDTWRGLIDVFGIKHSMIPDRSADEAASTQVGANGWYA